MRDRLTKYAFVGDATDPVGRVENAFLKVLDTQAVAKKVKAAIKSGNLTPDRELSETIKTALASGILTQSEADDYIEAERCRLDAIQVDDYTKAYIDGEPGASE